MKAFFGGSSLALALFLAGCGDNADTGIAAGNNAVSTAPLTQVEAPNGDWTAVVTETAEGGFLMGNPNAPVKLVEYGSLTCPACAQFSNTATEPLKNQYVKSGQVSWEFRSFVRDPIDLGVFLLVRCQGAAPYFRSLEQLYADQQNWLGRYSAISEADTRRIQSLPREQVVGAYAKAGGIDQFFRQRRLRINRAQSQYIGIIMPPH